MQYADTITEPPTDNSDKPLTNKETVKRFMQAFSCSERSAYAKLAGLRCISFGYRPRDVIEYAATVDSFAGLFK